MLILPQSFFTLQGNGQVVLTFEDIQYAGLAEAQYLLLYDLWLGVHTVPAAGYGVVYDGVISVNGRTVALIQGETGDTGVFISDGAGHTQMSKYPATENRISFGSPLKIPFSDPISFKAVLTSKSGGVTWANGGCSLGYSLNVEVPSLG